MKIAGKPIEDAPKDRAILAWCDHESDPCLDPRSTKGSLTLYAAHYEAWGGYAKTGFHIIEWGGEHIETSDEYGSVAFVLPDWWFVKDSEFQIAANPILWWELPELS